MVKWQPWQWPMDVVPTPQSVRFSRSLDGLPHEWEALVYLDSSKLVTQGTLTSIWLRDVQTNDHFVVCDSEGNRVSLSLGEAPDPYQVRMVCAESLTHNKIAHLFYLNEDEQLRERGQSVSAVVTIRPEGCGLWNSSPDISLYKSWERRASFRLPSAPNLVEFMRRPAGEVWHELTQALRDPQSDATFARDWTGKTHAEREAAICNYPLNARDRMYGEIEEWLHCVLLAEESLWYENERWQLSASDPTHIWLHNDVTRRTISPSMQRAINHIWQHYAPFNLDVLKHECALEWKRRNIGLLEIEASQPSAHERLEAAMRWRDWERQHL